MLKSRRYGYDGKGQAWVRGAADAAAAWAAIGEEPAVAEAGVDFLAEFSVILARWEDGRHAFWDLPENEHRDGILRRSTVPCGDAIALPARRSAPSGAADRRRARSCWRADGRILRLRDGPLVNEIAPRVHNSGHWTIEGALTSQFEQHIRAICDLPPGSTALAAAGARMDNLIGPEIERWPELVADPAAHVHIYGKGEARPGRKMGHVTRPDPLARHFAATISTGIPSLSSCGLSLAASPTTTQVKPLGSIAARAAWSASAVVSAR